MSTAVDVANAAHFDHSPSASSSWTTHSVAQRTSSDASQNSLSRGFSVLPASVSALIRSHNSSGRNIHIHDNRVRMAADDERPSRKSNPGNRLYDFIARSLTRSRSRSRSRNRRPPSIDHNEPMPQLPNPYEPTSSKPTKRLPSRPISATTTVTNTTITPGTPRAKRRPPTPPPVDEDTRPESRPITPRPSLTRRKLHNLFGIPLSPKKSSFSSSQNSSPRPSDVAIPSEDNDGGIEDNDPTPKPSKAYSFQPHSRPHSPTPNTQPTRNVSGSSTNTSSTSASSRLHKFLTGHKTSIHPRTDDVSGPLRRSSVTHHRNNSANGSYSPPMVSSDSKSMGPPPPRIVREPPTPVRSERPGPSNAFPEPSSSRRESVDYTGLGSSEGKGKEKEVLGGGIVNGRPVSASQRHSHRSTKHGSFDFERPGWSAGAVIKRSGSGGTTATGTTGTTGTFGPASLLGGIRESTMGPGMAGVGTLQRDMSMKRAKERDEMMTRAKEEERRRRKTAGQQAGKEGTGRTDGDKGKDPSHGRHRSLQVPSHGRSPDESNSGHTEKSSSWGRARGGIFRGKPKVTTIGLTHGPFSFEPAVSSPTWSVASTGNGRDAPASVSWGGEKGRVSKDKERSEPKRDLDRGRGNEKSKVKVKEQERGRDREEKERRRKSRTPVVGDRAPVPVPAPMSIGHRSGLKGRSLDLGLELAWAPNSVREEALLPSSGFFARSLSTSSSLAGHSVKSKSGSSANGRRGTIEEEKRPRPGIGREVAEVFKGALGPAGYAAFKEYVHRFDAHDIPFDGPTGIVARVERLLMTAPGLDEDGKRQLLDDFVRVILQNM